MPVPLTSMNGEIPLAGARQQSSQMAFSVDSGSPVSSGLSLRHAPRRRSGCPQSLQAIATARNSISNLSYEKGYHTSRPEHVSLSARRRSVVTAALCESARGEIATSNIQFRKSKSEEGRHSPDDRIMPNDIRRVPRRRTIYVPSDDTTIATIHPGFKHAIDSTDILNVPTPKLDGTGAQQDRLKPAPPRRRFSLAAAPKRAPLQMCLNAVNEQEDERMEVGSGPGKENIPPGGLVDYLPAFTKPIKRSRTQPRRSSMAVVEEDDCSTQAFGHVNYHKIVSRRQCERVAGIPGHFNKPKSERRVSNSLVEPRRMSCALNCKASKTRTEYSELTCQISGSSVIGNGFSLQNVRSPNSIEEHWLSDLEITMKEVVNQLFEKAGTVRSSTSNNLRQFRNTLVDILQGANCFLIQKRLTASLMFGALSPQHNTKTVSRPDLDVGLRSKMISFWLESYEVQPLLLAAEAILTTSEFYCSTIKRKALECVSPFRSNCNTNDAKLTRKQRKAFEKLFDAVLIMEDPVKRTSETGSWHRTMFVSLMLVLVLDKAKVAGSIEANLFRCSSSIKSSTAALEQLTSLLCPTTTSLQRRLKSLGYFVGYVQGPEAEYRYEVNNLAIDLRDGIRLHKLVEILDPCPHSKCQMPTDHHRAADGMINFPQNGSSPYSSCQILSREQQIANVALALQKAKAMPEMGMELNTHVAEDIVDSHREKSMTLLWSLLGNFGLGMLIDFKDLGMETKRLVRKSDCRKIGKVEEHPSKGIRCSKDLPGPLRGLIEWANAVAALHLKLDAIDHATGLCADSRLFHAIIDEYSPFLHQLPKPTGSEHVLRHESIRARLTSTGCSKSFGKSPLATTVGILQVLTRSLVDILAEDEARPSTNERFPVAAIAFLCCRFLAMTREGRAATTIVRAYRAYRLRHHRGMRWRRSGARSGCHISNSVRHKPRRAPPPVIEGATFDIWLD